jgi:hypothetical protein
MKPWTQSLQKLDVGNSRYELNKFQTYSDSFKTKNESVKLEADTRRSLIG